MPERELGPAAAEDDQQTLPIIKEDQNYVPIAQTISGRNDAILIPTFYSGRTAGIYKQQVDYNRPHHSPASVAITATGTMWRPGCWAAVADMFAYTQSQDINCWFNEIRDARTTIPYTSLGAMIDHACMQAHDRGFEYVFVVQTDILPRKDLLLHLLKYELPIMVPIIIDPDSHRAVGGPPHEPNSGLKPMRWVPFPAMLIKTTVFNCCDDFFGAQPTEDMTWERFWHYGHRPWMDTDQVLEMASHATRYGNLTYDEQHEWLRSVDERRRQTPDRSGPLDGSGKEYMYPVVDGEVYMPWRSPTNANGTVTAEELEKEAVTIEV